jgi:type IV secretion system protein TrbL
MSTPSRRVAILLFFMLLAVTAPSIAGAQVQTDNFLNTVIETYKVKAEQWKPVILDAAKRLFWALAIIEFAWMALMLGLRRADLTEWAAELVRHILFIGFFYAALMHSGEWSAAIVDSLWELAGQANASAGGSGGVNPVDIFDIGMDIALQLSEAYSVWRPGASLGLALAALIIAVRPSNDSASMLSYQ